MKVRIPEREKPTVNPLHVESCRRIFTSIADQILMENWHFGNINLCRFHEYLEVVYVRIMEECGTDRKKQCKVLSSLCEKFYKSFRELKGTGSSIELRREQDITVMSILVTLNRVFGFGAKRCEDFMQLLNNKTRYFNNNFQHEYISVLDVIESRNRQYNKHHAVMDWGRILADGKKAAVLQ